jgi:hypothetical protein
MRTCPRGSGEGGLLYAGTELGSLDLDRRRRHVGAVQGRDFPAVAVRDIASSRATTTWCWRTHGRGIWIIDDLTPLRALTPEILARKRRSSPPARSAAHPGQGGWVDGDAVYTGPERPNGAVITYYQKTRHLFGKLKLEVLDDKGTSWTRSPRASARDQPRRWNMAVKPRAFPARRRSPAQRTVGPRVVPGTYTVRMTKGSETYETKLKIELDPRSPFTAADRKEQFAPR